MGAYKASHKRSCRRTCSRAGRGSPGGGMSISSRARNTAVPNTRRIGCAKLPAVYWVTGVASGKPQSQGAERRIECDAQRWMTYAARLAATAIRMNNSNPLYELLHSATGRIVSHET